LGRLCGHRHVDARPTLRPAARGLPAAAARFDFDIETTRVFDALTFNSDDVHLLALVAQRPRRSIEIRGLPDSNARHARRNPPIGSAKANEFNGDTNLSIFLPGITFGNNSDMEKFSMCLVKPQVHPHLVAGLPTVGMTYDVEPLSGIAREILGTGATI
jgi:hypothetical protein